MRSFLLTSQAEKGNKCWEQHFYACQSSAPHRDKPLLPPDAGGILLW